MWMYSLICTVRNVRPSRKVATMPAFRPKRLPFLIDVSAQWIVSEEESRIAVFTPATSSGSLVPCAGQGSCVTTRMKKYAVKNAPKIITSDMMKSSIPSVGASTREERCAGGGPWCSWVTAAASTASGGRRLGLGVDHVLDRFAGGAPHALDQISAQPAGLRLREGRDHDVVDAEGLKRVHHRGVRIRIADHPGGVEAAHPQPVEHELQPRARPPRRLPVAALLGHDKDEQLPALVAPRLLGPLAQRLEQLVSRGGAVRDRQRDVERKSLRVDVVDDMGDR